LVSPLLTGVRFALNFGRNINGVSI
jgi:hypothetical protein